LFKNAGSSVDKLLHASFGHRWQAKEFSSPGAPADNTKIAAWLTDCTDIQAFSCHNARLPPPYIPDIVIFPILFVRHPILRIQSAYDFEKTQGDLTYGSRLAQDNDFKSYIQKRLSHRKDRSIQNFQSRRIADLIEPAFGNLFMRVSASISVLPFIGIVENFDESITELSNVLSKQGINFVLKDAHENYGPNRYRSLERRLFDIQDQLGRRLYEKLCLENAGDFFAYRAVHKRYNY
jgi:hypothetical protein